MSSALIQRLLAVNQTNLDNPMFIEAHRLAEFNPRGTDVPVVLDLMIHDIDAILSVVDNLKLKHVSAKWCFRNQPHPRHCKCSY